MTVYARAVKYGALSLPGVPTPGARERVKAGAFTDSLRSGDDILCLFNHSTDAVLGRTRNGSLQIEDDNESLRFTVRLNKGVSAHRDLYALVKAGTISECSFAFAKEDDVWETDPDDRRSQIRTIRKGKLFDLSLVTSPAYGDGATSATARSISYRFASPAFGPQGEPAPFAPAVVQRRVRETDEEFRCRVNLAIARSNEQFGNTLWIAEQVDERGVPKRLRPSTMEEYDAWLAKKIARVGAEIERESTVLDAYGRQYGIDPNFGEGC
jgi:HK97 family phage prohead protease